MNPFIGKLLYTSARLFNNGRSMFYAKNKFEKSAPSLDSKTHKWYNKNRPFGPLPKLCYAPWTNLFFNTDGKVIVCCKNTKVILGSYPENSIHDIWFGVKAELLREKILQNNLSMGCYKCLDSLQQKNANSLTAIQFDKFGMFPLSKYPRIIEFELSNRCNLACVMCSERVSSTIAHQNKSFHHSDMKYDDAFVHQLEEFIPHLYEAKFSGGEPFLIPIYYKIWENINKIKPSTKIFIQTNGTILNDEIKKIVELMSFRINVSLDSLNKENYENIRKNASYEETMNNIEWFGKHTSHLGIVATPFRNNWKDIPDIVLFCNKNKYHFNFSPVYHPKELSLWALDENSLREIETHYKNIHLPSRNWLEKENKKIFQELINSVIEWGKKKSINKNFNDHFSNFIFNQEHEFSDNQKKYIDLRKISQTKSEYQSKLLMVGFTSEDISNFDHTIKLNCESIKLDIPFDALYLKLQTIDPKDLIFSLKSLKEIEIHNKISALFKEITNEYYFNE
ncbi:MAG: twitch domain-containing radical SAM protein [Bacteroidota bacterium]